MATNLTTAPATLAVSLSDIKDHLRVDISTDDDLITSYINAAISIVQNKSNRQLITATYTTTLDDFTNKIRLFPSPLQSVTSINYVDTNGQSQTLSTSVYSVITNASVGYIVKAYGQSWPSTRVQDEAATIVWKAGYGDNASDVPDCAVQAIKLLCGCFYEQREAGFISKPIDFAVDALIDPIKVAEVF